MSILDSFAGKEKRIFSKVRKHIEKGKRSASRNENSQALEAYQRAQSLLDQNNEIVTSKRNEFS
jgi:hypothetical protein